MIRSILPEGPRLSGWSMVWTLGDLCRSSPQKPQGMSPLPGSAPSGQMTLRPPSDIFKLLKHA
eukprot:243863-Chlamydomonas_euryale.AAC.1